MIQEETAERIHSQLLFALESARMRFSVAIALEAKSTARDRWQYYLETTDRISRFIKKLRKANVELERDFRGWNEALERLCNLPSQGRASRLCETLREIVTELERRLHFLSA